MFTALKQLGYNPYHMAEAMKNPERDFRYWEEALDVHYTGKGRPYGQKEFDKILGDYDVRPYSIKSIPTLI
jgi:hypothetical protein